MEHLQSTTLLIQSIYFSQLVNKSSLLSTPMSQSARSHTTLAITWTLTPEPKFDSKNHSTQVWDTIWSRYQLTSYSSSTPSVYWSRLGSFGALFRESKGFQRLYNKTFQLEIRHVSFIHRLLSISEWLPNVCILWITLDNNSERMYKVASLVGQWRGKSLSTDDYSSSSFWKGTLPPYRETIDNDYNSIASPNSFHSIEDDGDRDGNQSTQDDMILSNSIVNLNIK